MSAKDDCYALIQEIAVARDIFCRAPGCWQMATAGHHLFKRDRMATAFMPKYVWGLCGACHAWAHAEPDCFRDWVIAKMGHDEYYDALLLSNTVIKNTDFNAVRSSLKEKLKKYKKP